MYKSVPPFKKMVGKTCDIQNVLYGFNQANFFYEHYDTISDIFCKDILNKEEGSDIKDLFDLIMPHDNLNISNKIKTQI